MEPIDWANLDFSYKETKGYAFSSFTNGAWSEVKFECSPFLGLHYASSAINYGQAAFEGLKAYRHSNDTINTFRLAAHGQRFKNTTNRLMIPEVPIGLFETVVNRCISENRDYVPPYGIGASLYIRPLIIGTSAQLGLGSAKEFMFLVYCSPVGDYYREGVKALSALIVDDYDRSAPLGMGNVKASGNYASTVLPSYQASQKGFPITLYLDAKEHRYIEEFATSNFVGITPDGTYVTPDSSTILPSITNQSLTVLAEKMGIKVERRPIPLDEIGSFTEIGACGTAVVISPISKVVHGKNEYIVPSGQKFGPTLGSLYRQLRQIQNGEAQDLNDWMKPSIA